ncbi:hypothetical protein M405DRAFT_232591 [Rhizopogon salebrosus TDB-379]|nr:hypothetical protein M405DRAFT_232591 [Rhizopogon salebrosus TDB-379]
MYGRYGIVILNPSTEHDLLDNMQLFVILIYPIPLVHQCLVSATRPRQQSHHLEITLFRCQVSWTFQCHCCPVSSLFSKKGSVKTERKSKETCKTLESRKRTLLAAIFHGGSLEARLSAGMIRRKCIEEGAAAPPIVTIEEASSDGHGQSDLETPMKRAWPRLMSEMLLGC